MKGMKVISAKNTQKIEIIFKIFFILVLFLVGIYFQIGSKFTIKITKKENERAN
jgi:hypothetical protein